MENKSQTHEEIYQNIEGIKTILQIPNNTISNTITTNTNGYFYVPVNQIYTGTAVNINKTDPILLRQVNPYISNSNLKSSLTYLNRNTSTIDGKLKGQNNLNDNNNNMNLIDENLEEEKIRKLTKEEFENLIIPYQDELRNNINKQRNFIERDDFESRINNIDKEINLMDDYMKNMQNNLEKNLKDKNQQFITRKEHEEAINNLLEKIEKLEKLINENGKQLERKFDEKLNQFQENNEKKNN